MRRHFNLRQIEAFKAMIEYGSVSSAAQMIHISQPAMSKLILNFEANTGLKLFDRVKGRLAPTASGMRLYQEIDRIFAGIRQVENAAEAIRREEQGRLTVGVLPALAGPFIQRVTTGFLRGRHNLFFSVELLTSQWIVDRLIARKLDVGLVSGRIDNPYVTFEPLMEHPLICILPLDHPLTARSRLEPRDLNRMPLVAFPPDSYAGHCVEEMFKASAVQAQVVLFANAAPIVCEFVAAGLGVALVHPLMASGFEGRLAVRRFEPDIPYSFQICRSAEARGARLVDAFAQELRAAAALVFKSMPAAT